METGITMLTILIPTRDRSEFLTRLMAYWADQGCRHPIVIGDSSNQEHFDAVQRAIDRFGRRLHVEHQRFPSYQDFPPGGGTIECMNGLLKQVRTPYAIFVADDDFAVPAAMDEAVLFLEGHPDYSCVLGDTGTFTVAGHAHGELLEIWRYPQADIEESTGRERLMSYLKDFSFTTEHAVKRTRQMQAQWGAALSFEMDNRFGETLVAGIAAIQGKIKKLNRLFLFRQNHEGMTSRKNRTIIHLDTITDPAFSVLYGRFRECLVETLMKLDGMDLEGAREVLREGFSFHLGYGLIKKRYRPQEIEMSMAQMRRLARSYPAVRQWGRKVRLLVPRKRTEFSLPALLQRTSLYHADFMPIYRAITVLPLALHEKKGLERVTS